MSIELMPHQVAGVEFLKDCDSALLHWDMGTGKTYPAAQAAGDCIEDGVCVWVGPAVSRRNAKREIEAIHGSRYTVKVIEKGSDKIAGADFYILSYDLVNRDAVLEKLFDLDIDVLVLDEVQYCKSHTSKRTGRILGHRGLASRARYVWGLTGTPCPNNISEIFPWVHSRHPEVIDTGRGKPMNFYEFRDTYCQMVETPWGDKIVGSKVEPSGALWMALDPVVDTIKKEAVLHDLPECRFAEIAVTGDKTVKHVRDLEEEYREQLDAVISGAAGAETFDMHLTTLKRATEMAKVGDAIEMIRQELEDGAMEKVVIFASFIDTIKALQDGLKEFTPRAIYGAVSAGARQDAIDAFQSMEDYRVMIGQTNAASTAITLHANGACQDVVFVSADWVPANNAQAVARVHRKGQRNAVLARFLHLENSLDEAIQKTLMRKSRQLATIYGEGVTHHAA